MNDFNIVDCDVMNEWNKQTHMVRLTCLQVLAKTMADWLIETTSQCLNLYSFLYADVDKSVWDWYEDGLMTFYT